MKSKYLDIMIQFSYTLLIGAAVYLVLFATGCSTLSYTERRNERILECVIELIHESTDPQVAQKICEATFRR